MLVHPVDGSNYLSPNPNGSSRYVVSIYSPVQMGSADHSKYLSSNLDGSGRYVVNIYSPIQMAADT